MDASSSEEEDYGLDFSEESDAEPNVALENQYYNSKSIKNCDPMSALRSFQKVLDMEGETKGDWGFRALKQMIKINFQLENFEEMVTLYGQLLTYLKSAVTRNYSEKSINALLDHFSSASAAEYLRKCYEMTLDTLKVVKNDRLWFKTNTKLAHLCYNEKNYFQLSKITKNLRQLLRTSDNVGDLNRGTQLLEIYALEIQMYTDQKQHKKLKVLYDESLRIRSALPHPNIMGIIRECGGKMHLRNRQFHNAHVDFFQAFKDYEECGSPKAPACLKYVLLANMLMKSKINPFDSPECKAYKDVPEVLAMTEMLNAYQANDNKGFERIVKQNQAYITSDPFILEHIEDLMRTVRIGFLTKLVKPYIRISLARIAFELDLDVDEVETLLVSCILDGVIDGRIDQKNGVLLVNRNKEDKARYHVLNLWGKRIQSLLASAGSKFP